jgi:hypothetical protein
MTTTVSNFRNLCSFTIEKVLNDKVLAEEFELSRKAPYSAPIDYEKIVASIEKYLNEDSFHNSEVCRWLKESVCTDDPVAFWMTYQVIWSLFWDAHKNKTAFKIDAELSNELHSSYITLTPALKACHEYQGANETDGLYGHIAISNNALIRKFGEGALSKIRRKT